MNKHSFQCGYTFGDIVFLRTDPEQNRWIVCEIEFRPGAVIYHLSCGKETYSAYYFEISEYPDEGLRLNLNRNDV